MPRELREGASDETRRAHLIATYFLVVVPGAVLIGAWHLVFGIPAAGLAYFSGALLGAVSLVVLHKTRSVRLTGTLLTLWWTLTLLSVAVMRGGLWTAPMLLTGLAPLLATLMVGWRHGLAWAGAVIAAFVTMQRSEAWLGVTLEDSLQPSLHTTANLMGVIIFITVVAGFGYLLEARLRSALDEAQRAERERVLAHAEARMLRSDRMASIGRIAAGAAHEINNPLSYLIGNLEHIRTRISDIDDLSEPAAELREVIHESLIGARRIRDIVKDLKTYGRDDEQTVAVDLHRVLDSTLRIVDSELRHSAKLVKRYSNIPAVLGSVGRLTQVFLNVLLNAIQAIEPGRIEENVVEVTTRVLAPGVVEVAIRDTGVGIEPELLEKVSEPFFTTKPVGEGTGLGLPVSRNILEGYGGSLAIESEPGNGTTVRVTMRVSEEEVDAPLSVPAPSVSLDVRARILLVDDDRLVVKSMRRVLRGHDLRAVESGREALELLRSDPTYDLVLCDLMMPDVSGMDVYETLIAEQPGVAERIVFMSGGAFTQRAQQFLDGVSNTFIEKPFDKGELNELVRRAVQRGA